MRTIAACLLSITVSAIAEDVADPQTDIINKRYEAGDLAKKMSFDINGDGIADLFFTTVDGNPDPTTKIADEQRGGSMSWDVYVSNPGANTFKVCNSLEVNGQQGQLQGVLLDLNPDELYVGNISEISRFGMVTSTVKRSKSENFAVIYAYTWEGDHFKQWNIAEYVVGEQNAIFSKYLKDDKRAHVMLQQVKP